MHKTARLIVLLLISTWATTGVFAQGGAKKKPQFVKAPGADLKQPIIWGSECESPDGTALRFGGCDQQADDGAAHTAIKVDGQWKVIVDELRKSNPLQEARGWVWAHRDRVKNIASVARRIFFQGAAAEEQAKQVATDLAPALAKVVQEVEALSGRIGPTLYGQTTGYHVGQGKLARVEVEKAEQALAGVNAALKGGVSADAIKALWTAQVALEQAAELLDCEPAPRALSPIAYDPKTKLFVIFGGDHLDYLTNDTWVFDPAKTQWEQRHPKTAPPPRANHTLTAAGDGKIRLSGGYKYNDIDIWYMGPLYQLLDDGDWVYDVAANTWTSEAGHAGVEPNQRTYRAKDELRPDHFLSGEKPDAAANEAKLAALPANTWVVMNPPVKLKQNRDWGSACIAADYDVMLRWSGGHSAHGGSDVPMYHFATNRWEMPFPIEFPLGQTYSNTSYPTGFNFNRRPWVSGHTYKNFGYDPAGKVMVFTGHNPWSYLFDPKAADWIGRSEKPALMNYGGSFYTLTLCTTDKGLYAWGGQYGSNNALHKWNSPERKWEAVKVTGAKLPGPAADHCGLAYDARRDRLIFFPKKYTDTLYALDCKTNVLSELKPGGANAAAGTVGFWRELACVPAADLIVVTGSSLAPAGEGNAALRPTLVYDCGANKWQALEIAGPHPAGKNGRDVSQGAVFDPKRALIWTTDTNGQVTVMRLEIAGARQVDVN